ncbi:MAG: hypothetical protein ABL866_15040 [Devosia sp.]
MVAKPLESGVADVAVFGATPGAALLAGALASEHGLSVALVGEGYSALRLPRGLNLAIGMWTRPDSWALLGGLEADLAALLGKAGIGDAEDTIDVTFAADLPATRETLDHMQHLAMGYGHKVARSRSGGELTIREVALLGEDKLYPRLNAWLDLLGVARVAGDASLSTHKTGKATIVGKSHSIGAKQVVLADDPAMISELSDENWPETLRAVDGSAILTSASRNAPPLVRHFPDRGTTVSTRGDGLLVHIAGTENREARLGASLDGRLPLVRVATRRLRKVVTNDGAPLVGWLKAPRVFIVAGLGDAAAFYAPALARLIAGTPSPEEKAWFAARDPSRLAGRETIAEFVAGGFG